MIAKMEVRADGRLAHHFWGTYCATIALCFRTAEHATLALPLLGAGWVVSDKRKSTLVWNGTGEELKACKGVLASFGADAHAIDSIDHSIDYGDPFTVSLEVEDPAQLPLPLAGAGGDCPACSGTSKNHGKPYQGGEVCFNDRTDRVRR